MGQQDTCHTPSYPLLHLGGGQERFSLDRGARGPQRRAHAHTATQRGESREERPQGGDPNSQPHIQLDCLCPSSWLLCYNILGEPIPPSQHRRSPLTGPQALVPSAVLDTESLLKHLGWEKDSLAQAGVLREERPGRQAIAGRGGHPAGRCYRARKQCGGRSRGPECQGQDAASSSGLWEGL